MSATNHQQLNGGDSEKEADINTTITRTYILHTTCNFDMESVRCLNLSSCGLQLHINDQVAFNLCLNLVELNLSKNQISDLSCLSKLNFLEVLDLSCNQISNIDPLSSLTNLYELKIGGNQITSITSLTPCSNLNKLQLSTSRLSNPICYQFNYPTFVVDCLQQIIQIDGLRVRGRGSNFYQICNQIKQEEKKKITTNDNDVTTPSPFQPNDHDDMMTSQQQKRHSEDLKTKISSTRRSFEEIIRKSEKLFDNIYVDDDGSCCFITDNEV